MKILTKNIRLLGLLFFIVIGCQSPQDDKSMESVTEDIMEYEMPAEREPLVFERTKGEREKDTISFDLDEPGLVKMKLSVPGDSGNIRINQLVMPNGEMDGPFGKTYEANLEDLGTYQVIIGASMMAENPYIGDYRLEIDL